ncbi:hypothetical protein Hanom_Chr01g00001041 [Helianthus anomalus]
MAHICPFPITTPGRPSLSMFSISRFDKSVPYILIPETTPNLWVSLLIFKPHLSTKHPMYRIIPIPMLLNQTPPRYTHYMESRTKLTTIL